MQLVFTVVFFLGSNSVFAKTIVIGSHGGPKTYFNLLIFDGGENYDPLYEHVVDPPGIPQVSYGYLSDRVGSLEIFRSDKNDPTPAHGIDASILYFDEQINGVVHSQISRNTGNPWVMYYFIKNLYKDGDKVVLLGYSGGGSYAIVLAAYLRYAGIPVELLGLMDAVIPIKNPPKIPKNVVKVALYYQDGNSTVATGFDVVEGVEFQASHTSYISGHPKKIDISPGVEYQKGGEHFVMHFEKSVWQDFGQLMVDISGDPQVDRDGYIAGGDRGITDDDLIEKLEKDETVKLFLEDDTGGGAGTETTSDLSIKRYRGKVNGTSGHGNTVDHSLYCGQAVRIYGELDLENEGTKDAKDLTAKYYVSDDRNFGRHNPVVDDEGKFNLDAGDTVEKDSTYTLELRKDCSHVDVYHKDGHAAAQFIVNTDKTSVFYTSTRVDWKGGDDDTSSSHSDHGEYFKVTITSKGEAPKPDLYPSVLSLDRTAYHPGDKIKVTTRIHNGGGKSSETVARAHTKPHSGGSWTHMHGTRIDPLDSGEGESWRFENFKAPQTIGNHYVRVCSDDDRTSIESDEDNNCRLATYRVDARPEPNLVPSGLRMTNGKTSILTWDRYGLQVTVKNAGGAQSSSARVYYDIRENGSWRNLDSDKVDALNPGQSSFEYISNSSLKRAPLVSGSYPIRACINGKCAAGNLIVKSNSHSPVFKFGSAGPTVGMNCVQTIELADPHTWDDNYFCSRWNHKMRWSSAGRISGMRCTQILEAADPHTWRDNYLCLPHASSIEFRFFSSGVSGRGSCARWHEPADPHTWHDNYLCWATREKARSSDGSYRVYRYYETRGGNHYFNIYNSTKAYLENRPDWGYDNHGATFRAFASQKSGTVPIYHCWNSSFRTHRYGRNQTSTKKSCGSSTIPRAFYGYATAGANRIPVWELWHPRSKVYIYSNGESDANSLVSRWGFQKKYIAWYAPK